MWDSLIDWKGHEAWIPATKIEIHSAGNPTAVGASFTATTGFGPLALPDNMTVTRCAWDESTLSGDCEVEKHGLLLFGSASFTVSPKATGSEVVWMEDLRVRRLPQIFAPIARWVGAFGFRMGMRNLAKQLRI